MPWRQFLPGLSVCALVSSLPLSSVQAQTLALEEIIVTAQKRAQSVQDVPIAITALSEEMLANQNIYDVLDLQRAVPSLTVVRGYNKAISVPIVIRGMGTVAAQPAFEGSVGTYLDGVYRSRPGMVLSSMLDIGRVEILRGPQGTLFGKNTTAGAIALNSNEPQDEFGFGGELTLGDYDRQRFAGHITGGLGENVAARLALLSDERDGFAEALFDHDDYGSLDNQSAKLSLVWDAADTLTIKTIIDYAESDEVCCFGNNVSLDRASSLGDGEFTTYNREAAQGNFDTQVDLLNLDPDDRENQNNYQPSNDSEDKGALVDIAWDLGFAELRSISAYREWDYNSNGDFDFGPVDIGRLDEDYNVDTVSQEFNLTGSVDGFSFVNDLEYVLGLYYNEEDYEQARVFDAGPDQAGIWEIFWPATTGVPEPVLRSLLGGGNWATEGMTIGNVDHDLNTETVAAFAHVTAALTEQLSLILGLRYTDEEKTLDRYNRLFSDVQDYGDYLQEFMLGGWLLGANSAGPDIQGLKYSDDEWTYDIKLQYFLTEDAQLYGGYSRGFKSGGIGMDPEAGGGQPSGQNSQVVQDLAGIGNGTGFADLEEITYEPEYVDTWEIGLKADYLEGRGRINVAAFYNDLEDNQFSVFTGTGFRVENASSADVSGIELENFFLLTEHLSVNLSVTWLDTEFGDDIPEPAPPGRDLTYAPDWAGVINLAYERPITAGWLGFFNANWTYTGDQYLSYDLQNKQGDYDLLGLQAGVRTADGHWDLRVWCDNCTDEFYATGYYNVPFYFTDDLGQYQGQFPGAPRTWGGTLRFSF